MTIIDNKSIDDLFSTVTEWFEAMGEVLSGSQKAI
jgi:hypothetical protein